MKTILNLILMSLFATSAQATSFIVDDACTPVSKYQPHYISCAEKGLFYSFEIETITPLDPARCSEPFEDKMGELTIGDQWKKLSQHRLPIGSVQVKYSRDFSEVRVIVPSLKLDLKNCSAPEHGGAFSLGN